MDEENVLEFLTSLEAMDLPDRIEEVNSKILGKIVEDTDFVAVLFCKLSMLFTLIIIAYAFFRHRCTIFYLVNIFAQFDKTI